VREAAEVADADVLRAGGRLEQRPGRELARARLSVLGRVVQEEPQAGSQRRQRADEVRLVEVVGEDVEAEERVGERLFEEAEEELARAPAEPAPALLERRRVEVDRRASGLERSVVEALGVCLRREVPARDADIEAGVAFVEKLERDLGGGSRLDRLLGAGLNSTAVAR
jgi:hypothetical protein